jgi:8-oxo-dGTP pyrophosphatase MutT (NUDIX family)
VNLRHATRGLILDSEDRILLMHCELPHLSFWLAPGGGLEPGESHHEGLTRELREELGLESADIQDHVWRQEAVGPYAAGYDGVRNDYYIVRIEHFTPEPRPDWEVEMVSACRWWTVDELLAADVEFSPRAMPALVHALLTDGVPAEPLLLGV